MALVPHYCLERHQALCIIVTLAIGTTVERIKSGTQLSGPIGEQEQVSSNFNSWVGFTFSAPLSLCACASVFFENILLRLSRIPWTARNNCLAT